MMRTAAAALVALIATSAAAAASPPTGFRESVRLTPRAQAISGNPEAVVYCATSAAAFTTKVREVFNSEPRGDAFTVYSEDAAYFQAHLCASLENWLRGKPVTRYEVGVAALTLGHEAGHLSGIREDRAAECWALAPLARTLRTYFAVKNLTALREMLAAAQAYNRRRPSMRC